MVCFRGNPRNLLGGDNGGGRIIDKHRDTDPTASLARAKKWPAQGEPRFAQMIKEPIQAVLGPAKR